MNAPSKFKLMRQNRRAALTRMAKEAANSDEAYHRAFLKEQYQTPAEVDMDAVYARMHELPMNQPRRWWWPKVYG